MRHLPSSGWGSGEGPLLPWLPSERLPAHQAGGIGYPRWEEGTGWPTASREDFSTRQGFAFPMTILYGGGLAGHPIDLVDWH